MKDPSGTINFEIGQPSADLLPVDLIRLAADNYLSTAESIELNYGDKQGDPRFRETLAVFLGRAYGEKVTAQSLFVTAGNSQALDFVCTQFTRPGDTIFIEEPTYYLVFQILADHGLNVVGIPVDESGINIDRLETELAKRRPALLYTIPSFHNPSGFTMSAERRKQLVALSQQHGFLIVADEVYHLLSYYGDPPCTLGSFAESGTILSLGSFSKILAPGLRLGWIQGSAGLVERLVDSGVINSGGSFNHLTSNIVRRAIEMGLQESHLERLRDTYHRRVEIMDAALHRHLEDCVSWRRPDGGYYFWLELAESIDATVLRGRAVKRRVSFQPGENFSSCGGLKNYARLSFAYHDDAAIREGVARLGALLQA
ncbi:MAG: PLP-dependent aminotransferase family protein [Acidobacteriota bacterium]